MNDFVVFTLLYDLRLNWQKNLETSGVARIQDWSIVKQYHLQKDVSYGQSHGS